MISYNFPMISLWFSGAISIWDPCHVMLGEESGFGPHDKMPCPPTFENVFYAFEKMAGWLAGCCLLAGCLLAGWLAGWMASWLAGWLAGLLADWLAFEVSWSLLMLKNMIFNAFVSFLWNLKSLKKAQMWMFFNQEKHVPGNRDNTPRVFKD